MEAEHCPKIILMANILPFVCLYVVVYLLDVYCLEDHVGLFYEESFFGRGELTLPRFLNF